MTVLATSGVTKKFKIPGQKPIEVLKGVDFSVEEGEKVTAKLGEAREVEPVWHQLNIEY